MKLSTKLALLVFVSLSLIIIAMGTSFYFLSKSFYKEQLQLDIEHRLSAHREVIEAHTVLETFEHVIKMEKRREENAFIIFDNNLNVLYFTQIASDDILERYQQWLSDMAFHFDGGSEFMETVVHHIPHIWSFQPLKIDGRVVGYLFLDQDTGNFEQARVKLLAITIVMGIITLVFTGVLTILFTRKITIPLIGARNLTKEIAQGNFDIQLENKGNDEIADLNKHISSMAKQLKEYRDTRQQFLTNISHDLRTPLTYMKAYAAILKEQQLKNEIVKEQATIIYQEANRMEGMVNDLFQLMKLKEGTIQLHTEQLDLVDFIQDIGKKVTLAAAEKEIELIVTATHPQIIVTIDPDQFERAVLNLLNNSIRHTPHSGTIEIRLHQQENKTIIEIEDNGEGIPSEDLDHIWDRFYRVDKSRSTKQGGSGLGLTITKQIIEYHGGKISLESTVNKGTKFTIEL